MYTGLVYTMLGEEGTFFLTIIISIKMSGFGLYVSQRLVLLTFLRAVGRMPSSAN